MFRQVCPWPRKNPPVRGTVANASSQATAAVCAVLRLGCWKLHIGIEVIKVWGYGVGRASFEISEV